MGKQAMGLIAHNQADRIDTILYLLLYPHKPLVKTRTIDLIGYEQLPAGHNATVSVMSYSGYDIEDALILNKASLDRGFGRCMVLKKFSCALKKYPNGTQDRAMPPQKPDTKDEKARRRAQMSKVVDKFKVVDEDGICGVGMRLEHNDVLVNKFTPTDTRGDLGAGMDPEQLPDSARLLLFPTLSLTLTLTLTPTLTLSCPTRHAASLGLLTHRLADIHRCADTRHCGFLSHRRICRSRATHARHARRRRCTGRRPSRTRGRSATATRTSTAS